MLSQLLATDSMLETESVALIFDIDRLISE